MIILEFILFILACLILIIGLIGAYLVFEDERLYHDIQQQNKAANFSKKGHGKV